MPGPWVTPAAVKTALAAILKKSEASLQGYWDTIINDAVGDAYADLTSILLAKGYTIGQLDSWDERERYNKDLALFWCLVKGGGLSTYNDVNINKLDSRAGLEKSATIMIGGNPVTPGGVDEGGGLGFGTLTQGTTTGADGINYGTTFGLRTQRRDGVNQYGDLLNPPHPGTG